MGNDCLSELFPGLLSAVKRRGSGQVEIYSCTTLSS